MHADEEAMLLSEGSLQTNLWGINLHTDQFGTTDFVEFDSMINLRLGQGNSTRGVEDPTARVHHVGTKRGSTRRWTALTVVDQLVTP